MNDVESWLADELEREAEHAPAPRGLLEKVRTGSRRRTVRGRAVVAVAAVGATALSTTIVLAGPVAFGPAETPEEGSTVKASLCLNYRGDRLSSVSLQGHENGEAFAFTDSDPRISVDSALRISVRQGALEGHRGEPFSVRGRAGVVGEGELYVETGVRDSLLHITGRDRARLLAWARGITPGCGR